MRTTWLACMITLSLSACAVEEEQDSSSTEEPIFVDESSLTCSDDEEYFFSASEDGAVESSCASDGELADLEASQAELYECLSGQVTIYSFAWRGSSFSACIRRYGNDYCGRVYVVPGKKKFIPETGLWYYIYISYPGTFCT